MSAGLAPLAQGCAQKVGPKDEDLLAAPRADARVLVCLARAEHGGPGLADDEPAPEGPAQQAQALRPELHAHTFERLRYKGGSHVPLGAEHHSLPE